MAKPDLLKEGGDWFDRLYVPSSQVFKIVNARRPNNAKPFEPARVLRKYERTREKRIAEFRDAVTCFKLPEGSRKK